MHACLYYTLLFFSLFRIASLRIRVVYKIFLFLAQIIFFNRTANLALGIIDKTSIIIFKSKIVKMEKFS